MAELQFLDDVYDHDDTPDTTVRRGRRPGRPGDGNVIALNPDQKSVTVLDPWRVVDDNGHAYMPGDTATIPTALADQWIRYRWATEAGK